jgi:hypothetical protein
VCFLVLMDIQTLLQPCIASHACSGPADGLSLPSSIPASTPRSRGRWRLRREQCAPLAILRGGLLALRHPTRAFWQSRRVPPDALDLCQRAHGCRVAACAPERAAWDLRHPDSLSLSGLSRPVWAQVPAILFAACRKPKQGA